jgi:branched-chain amino acid transport system substrate-binding protein
LAAPLVVGALALSACGSNKSESGTSSSGGTTGKTATIGLSAPLSGSLSSLGLGMKNSVDLAVKQANQQQKVKGWTLKLDAEDDQAQANVGQQVASKLASQKDVVAVVGPLNSSVGQQEQPVYAQANVTQISPANTNPTLTQGPDYSTGTKKRPFASYFRTATTDAVQGPFAAQYLVQTAGKKKVALVNDKKTYGAGLVAEFKKEFTKEGGQVVAEETINPGDKDFSAVISKIKPSAPDALYYGGEYPEASLLSSQMKQANLNVPLMGGDGIFDPAYIDVAKAAAEGDLATSVGAPAESLDTAKQFVSDYKAANYSEPFAAYGAYTYDAANVIIAALAQVLPGKSAVDDSVRQAVVKAVQGSSITGATGKVSFDEFGDTTNKTLTVYKVTSGAWKSEKTGSFQG